MLAPLDAIIFVLAVWLMVEAFLALRKARATATPAGTPRRARTNGSTGPPGDESSMTVQVVLVRPWTDGRGGGGCCGGEVRDGVCLDGAGVAGTPPAVDLVARTWQRLRAELPEVDVQLVDAGNTAYLVPARSGRYVAGPGCWPGCGPRSSRTTAGAVLVDGERVGDLDDLGPDGILKAVAVRLGQAPLGTT